MTNDAERIEALFEAAIDLPLNDRGAFLDERCADDPHLRGRVEQLLQLDGAEGGVLAKPTLAPAAQEGSDSPYAFAHGTIVADKYRIERVIGEGGMGTVFLATQLNPPRPVALKVIRGGWLTPQLLRRFEREARALGRLRHPGIATIFEAGSVALGGREHPFFAMEFVDGLQLMEHAARYGLDVRERISIVALIADAVQHAHEQHVIHRDLKPANVLVENGPGLRARVKVLDFGVARFADPAATGPHTFTAQTDAGQLIGTLPYMSPEQVGGDSGQVDVQSDVYALGVILFELLTGRLPYSVRGKSVAEAARIIRDEDPTRLSSIDPQLRGDLETIVLKAIEKEKQRRYGSAAELAADLRRYLREEPIAARPPSAAYRFRKFARRNRTLVGGVIGIIMALAGGLVLTSVFAVRAGHSAELARRAEHAALNQQHKAERQAYRASLTAAVAALENHDVRVARVHLEAAPAALRGWEWRHLFSRLDDSIIAFDAGDATGVAWFHPSDGSVLGALGHGTIALARWSLDGHEAQRMSDIISLRAERSVLGLSSSGSAVGWVDEDNHSFHIFHLASGEHRRLPIPVELQPLQVMRLAVNDEGTVLVACFRPARRSEPMPLFGIDLTSGKSWRSDDTRGAWNGEVALGPSTAHAAAGGIGPLVALASAEFHAAQIYNPADQSIVELVGHTDGVTSIAFSPDGSRIATASRDNTCRLWDVATGRMIAIGRGRKSAMISLAFSPDGGRIATGSVDGTVRLWDSGTHTGSEAALAGGSPVRPRGPWSWGGELKFLAVLHGHEEAVRSVAFSADGRTLISLSNDRVARLWSVRHNSEPFVLRGHTSYVYPVAVSPDGRTAASGSWDRSIRHWDIAAQPAPEALAILHGHQSFVEKLAFSGDGRLLASFGTDNDSTLRVWDVDDAREIGRLPRPHCHQIAFHPDNRRVFLNWVDDADQHRIVAARYWDPFTNSIEDEPLPAAAHQEHAGLLSPDSTLAFDLQGGEYVWQVRVFDAHSGRIVCEFPIGGGRATAGPVQWLVHDPPRLVATDEEGGTSLVIRDALSGDRLTVLRAHAGQIFGLALSPDGSRLVSGGGDQTISVWDLTSVAQSEDVMPLVQLRGHESYIWSLAFTPDGSRLISGSGDHTVRIWDTQPLAARSRR